MPQPFYNYAASSASGPLITNTISPSSNASDDGGIRTYTLNPSTQSSAPAPASTQTATTTVRWQTGAAVAVAVPLLRLPGSSIVAVGPPTVARTTVGVAMVTRVVG